WQCACSYQAAEHISDFNMCERRFVHRAFIPESGLNRDGRRLHKARHHHVLKDKLLPDLTQDAKRRAQAARLFVRSGCPQAALSAVILWPMEVWTSNVRISGSVSSKGVSISWILGNCSWW